MNKKIKFRFRLKDKENNQHIRLRQTIDCMMQIPINLKQWEVLSIDEYTGAIDDKGNEIYGGNIISVASMCPGGNDLIGTVEFLECAWWIRCKGHAVSLFTETDKLVVISDIHQ